MGDIIEPVELEIIETSSSDKPDDVFICWASPEERCKGTILKLSPNYKARKIFILKYTNHESEKREKNLHEIKDKLKNHGEIEEFLIYEDAPLPIMRELVKEIENSLTDYKHFTITIDISTPIKWHLLILLKLLDLRSLLDNTRILYTEPKDYSIELFQPLSFGIREIFPIPLFHNYYDFSKNDLLVLILGYEGSRAMALYENIDPVETLLLIADPPYRPEWRGRTEEMNREIINTVGESKIKYIDSRNPILIAKQLFEILSDEKYTQYNHIISPLGTKPQALGLYIYLTSNPQNIILLYGAPLRHNNLFYSYGIGRTWKLPFKKIYGDRNGDQKYKL